MVAAVHDGKDLRKKIVFNLKRKSEGATDDLAISLTSKPPQTTYDRKHKTSRGLSGSRRHAVYTTSHFLRP